MTKVNGINRKTGHGRQGQELVIILMERVGTALLIETSVPEFQLQLGHPIMVQLKLLALRSMFFYRDLEGNISDRAE